MEKLEKFGGQTPLDALASRQSLGLSTFNLQQRMPATPRVRSTVRQAVPDSPENGKVLARSAPYQWATIRVCRRYRRGEGSGVAGVVMFLPGEPEGRPGRTRVRGWTGVVPRNAQVGAFTPVGHISRLPPS